jgi:hypothetical protein
MRRRRIARQAVKTAIIAKAARATVDQLAAVTRPEAAAAVRAWWSRSFWSA